MIWNIKNIKSSPGLYVALKIAQRYFDLAIMGPSGSLFFVPDYRKLATVRGIA
jgi:hypothetical protein